MAYGHSSGLLPQEAPIMIPENHRLFSSYAVLPCRACSAGRLDSARALVEGGKARLEAKDASGATPMGVAASCGDQTMTLYLLSKGADPEVCKSASSSMLPTSTVAFL